MQELDEMVSTLRRDNTRKDRYRASMEEALRDLDALNTRLETGIEAQQLLGTVADERSTRILQYVTGIVNKALGEIFPESKKYITLEKKLHSGRYPHINVTLDADGVKRDLMLQSGTGLRQVVALLYRLCLIEINGGRKLLLADELLSGVHPDAAKVIVEILEMFADSGFQIIFIEYTLPKDFGKVFKVTHNGHYATIAEVDSDEETPEYLAPRTEV